MHLGILKSHSNLSDIHCSWIELKSIQLTIGMATLWSPILWAPQKGSEFLRKEGRATLQCPLLWNNYQLGDCRSLDGIW